MVDEPTQPPQPLNVANYRLGRMIGQGGWGVVYEAVNTRNDERVALKLLHAHLASDEAYLERFQREAQVATLLRSPYTVHLLDFGVDAGRHFLVMNLVEGEILGEIVKAGPLPPARAFKIASQIALALEEAEARGVVHRDIKPDNVMVTPEAGVKVLDFGIARQAGRATLTGTGAFIGTLVYAAPEAAEGRVDHRSDLYSLGVTLFHMLTGQPPFMGEMIQLLRDHRETAVPRRLLDGLPDDAIAAVLRLLEKVPDDRYQTASETAGVLEHLGIDAAARADAPLEMEATEPLVRTADTSLITMVLQPSGVSRRFMPRAGVTRYELRLQNEGSHEMTLRLAAADPSDSCEIVVPEAVSVPPRSETTVTISIAPRRRRWRGRAEQRPFRVTASGEGGGPPVVAVGEFEDRPEGLLPVAGGALFSIALIGVIAALLLGGNGGVTTAQLSASVAPVAGSSLDDQGTLRLDITSAGAIAEPGEVDAWTFSALAGQVLTLGIVATDSEAFHPYVELVAPSGALLGFVAGEDGEAWLDGVRFAAAGQYLLRVRSFDAFDRGGYTIELFDEPADYLFTLTDSAPGDEELPVDGVAFASLSAAQSVDWTFSGEAGEVMSVGAESYVFAPFDLFVELIGPDGASLGRDGAIGSGAGWLDDVSLPQSGLYVVRVSTLGGAGGMYGVTVERAEAAATTSPTPAATDADGQSGITVSGTQGTTISQALLSALSSIDGNRPRAVVGSEGAVFFFPLDTSATFEWDLAGTAPNTPEYQWSVRFTLAGTTFMLMMTQARTVDEAPRLGSFPQLVDASFVTLRRQAAADASTVLRDAGPLLAVASEDGLVLAIADPQYVFGLRQQRPEEVRFTVSGTLQQRPSQAMVTVAYVQSLAALPSFGGLATPATSAQPAATSPPDIRSAEPPTFTGGASVVLNREARFFFTLDTRQTFRWNAPSTPDGSIELMWAVKLPLNDRLYELRLTHIKQAGATLRFGDLEAFLRVAQLNVWELTSDGRSTTLPTTALEASVVPGGLELVLGDAASVRLLREGRPATLTLITGGVLQQQQEVVTTVQYEDSGPP
ncbi:MAG: serine/threonine-protein kinase [Dehalococcoidia bacterium]